MISADDISFVDDDIRFSELQKLKPQLFAQLFSITVAQISFFFSSLPVRG